MKTLSINITLCSLVMFLCLSISLAQTSEEVFEVPPAPSGYTSTYTPLTDAGCHYLELSVWDEDAPIDYFTLECPAYAGYRVLIAGGDLRSHLEIVQHGEDIPQVHSFYRDVWPHVGQFPYVSGSVLEWRYHWTTEVENTLPISHLVGIIYRVAGSDPEDFSESSKLVTVRLDDANSPCLLGVVESNEEARSLVDTPTTPCHRN